MYCDQSTEARQHHFPNRMCVHCSQKVLLWAIEPDWLETVYMFVMSNVMPFYLSAHRELAIVSTSYTSNHQGIIMEQTLCLTYI